GKPDPDPAYKQFHESYPPERGIIGGSHHTPLSFLKCATPLKHIIYHGRQASHDAYKVTEANK
ncbi:MAG TPA: hypothetical protein PKA39_04030, partial [Ignavibacteria bacterium]|nr:hypothetical protein [Ignavibacteria bacterium]